jgi:hypothetical protein
VAKLDELEPQHLAVVKKAPWLISGLPSSAGEAEVEKTT